MLNAKTIAAACAVLILTASGCAPARVRGQEWSMGEKVPVGPLIYHVIDTEWKSQLGEFPDMRTPERNFLLIHLSVTNSGGQAFVVPQITLENSTGDSFRELTDGRLVPGWLGTLRKIEPGETDEGWIVFDVPTNTYRLRFTDGNGPESEKFAFVKLPLTFNSDSGPAPMQ